MKYLALHQLDFYKVGHQFQYPKGTEYVYSNMTARSNGRTNIPITGNRKGIYFVGLQAFIISQLIENWNETFFFKDKDIVIDAYQQRTGLANIDHIANLHELGYLPLRIKALPEGSFVPYKVPFMTLVNTHKDFGWVTNMIESAISAELWPMINTATTTAEYLRMFYKYAKITGGNDWQVPWQPHNFSYRGCMGVEAAAKVGLAALLVGAKGTDSVPALDLAEELYFQHWDIGGSIPATEHSVMCAGGEESEEETFRRLIQDVYPSGAVSIVSDTWDFWNVVSVILPKLKNLITSRDGIVVIRPDSGDPVKIICGNDVSSNIYEAKGLIESLWDIFGGSINDKGYKVLHPKIGAIYGDSITLERQAEILQRLEAKGFASSNIVLGVGSYSYQYTTRDTHALAIKATNVVINGESKPIFKDPITDDGMKKSAKGLIMVTKSGDEYAFEDNVTPKQEAHGCLKTVFEDGMLIAPVTLSAVRDLAKYSILKST